MKIVKKRAKIRDIDLMGSDNEEDEEEIELENEKDRAFLNDEIQEQEDVPFYRRFHVELNRGLRQEQRQQQQELATYEDMLFGQEQNPIRRKTERLYTRTASAGLQFWEVRPECHQRIPVPVLNQASSYQAHCEKKQ